jgi:hypothetical protein
MLLLGCAPADLTPSLESTAIPTVFQVSWQSEQAGQGKVEYGPTKDYGYGSAWGESGTEHKSILFGIPPGETWHWRTIFKTDDGRFSYSESATVTAGEPPEDLPELVVEGEGMGDRLLLFSMVYENTYVVIDGLGRYRWWLDLHKDSTEFNTLRVRLSKDNTEFIYQLVNNNHRDPATIGHIAFDGSIQSKCEIPAGSHDFVETTQGIVSIAFDTREHVRGDQLIEADSSCNQRRIFSTWDYFEAPPPADESIDWTHANSLDYEDSRYLLSLRNLGSILSVSENGILDWIFSGEANQFTFTKGTGFSTQHQFDLKENQLLVYANTWPDGFSTSVAAYEFDEANKQAKLLWRQEQTPRAYEAGYGSVAQLPDEEILIDWGTLGELELFDASRERIWTLKLSEAIGYVSVLELSENGLETQAD